MTDITRIDPPELEGTTWNFAGGYLDGEEMDDDDATQTLSLYGGTLQFVFGEDGAMQIVQGGGSLDGVYELLQDDDGSLCVGVTVDNDGQSIPYFCVFSDLGQTVMIALSDDSGLNGPLLRSGIIQALRAADAVRSASAALLTATPDAHFKNGRNGGGRYVSAHHCSAAADIAGELAAVRAAQTVCIG